MDEQHSVRRDRSAGARKLTTAMRRSTGAKPPSTPVRTGPRARERLAAQRLVEEQAILDDAAQRDGQADARDSLANDRDRAASLESFLHDEDFNPGVRARRAAGMDRSDSRDDRATAAADRSRLAGGERTDPVVKHGERDHG
jgi:hypothetical protein